VQVELEDPGPVVVVAREEPRVGERAAGDRAAGVVDDDVEPAVRLRGGSEREAATTRAPSSASVRATARPMPLDAPVTSATRSVRRWSMPVQRAGHAAT
jgi:hypothetical protein